MADRPDPSAPSADAASTGTLVTPRFLVVTAATFCYFVALGSLLPVLPRYIEDELGGDGAAVGLGLGAFAVSAALVRPWVGRQGDRRGRRVLIVGGAALVAVSVAAYSLATSLAILVALRLVTGLGEAAVFVGAATAVQDMAPDHRRGEAASYFSVALYAGLAIGPVMGESVLEASGFDAVWLAAAAAATVAAVLGTRAPVGTLSDATTGGPWLHRAALGPGFVLLLGLLPFVGFASFIAIYGEDIGIDDTAPFFLSYAGLVLLIRIFGARLPDRLGWRRASTVALASVVVAGVVLTLSTAAAGIYVATVFLAIGMALLFPALFSFVVSRAPEEERSTAVGTFSVFFDLSQAVGAPVLGIAVTLSGDDERAAFLVSAVLASVGFLAAARLAASAAADRHIAGEAFPDEPAAG